MLVGIHGGLALLSGRVEWALDTDSKIFDGMTEAEFLSKSIKDVADHYSTGLLDQKQLDWANLIQCLFLVYGGRIYAIRSTPKVKAPQQPNAQEAARTFNPAPPATTRQFHDSRLAEASRAFSPSEPATRGDIPGVGSIDVPDDHPLSPNYKPRYN